MYDQGYFVYYIFNWHKNSISNKHATGVYELGGNKFIDIHFSISPIHILSISCNWFHILTGIELCPRVFAGIRKLLNIFLRSLILIRNHRMLFDFCMTNLGGCKSHMRNGNSIKQIFTHIICSSNNNMGNRFEANQYIFDWSRTWYIRLIYLIISQEIGSQRFKLYKMFRSLIFPSFIISTPLSKSLCCDRL